MKSHSSLSQVDKDEVESQQDWLSATAFLAFPPLFNASASLNVTAAKVTLQENLVNLNILELQISSETRSHDSQALIFQIQVIARETDP